jgi:type I restriction enzyme R subunit
MTIAERGFEDAIAVSLVESGGYRVCKWGTQADWLDDFDRVRCLDTAELFAFIAATQPQAWDRLLAVHGGEDGARTLFADRLSKQLDERGTVDVLRHGVNDHGVEVRLAYFKPAHGLTPELTDRYLANRLTVTRQLPYDPAATKTLDLCLFVNGIPVATAELKNPLTHQNVEHAKA